MTAVTIATLTLLATAAWLLPLLDQPTVAFGVRIPGGNRDAGAVVANRRRYRRQVTAAALLVPVAAVLMAVTDRWWPAAAAAVGISAVTTVAYLHAHRAIASAKRQQGWYVGLSQVTAVDTSLRTRPEPFPWRWAVPAVLVVVATTVAGLLRYPDLPGMLTVHVDASGVPDRQVRRSVPAAFGPVFAQLLLTGLLIAVTRAGFSARAEIDPADPAASAARHRRFLAGFARRLLVLAACVNLALAGTAGAMWYADPPRLIWPLVAVPIAVGVATVVTFAVRAGQGGHRLPLDPTAGTSAAAPADATRRDDDAHWRLGLVYVNPADSAVLVPQRVGVGWTLNLARPLAWLAMGTLLGVPAVAAVLLTLR